MPNYYFYFFFDYFNDFYYFTWRDTSDDSCVLLLRLSMGAGDGNRIFWSYFL